MRRDYRWGIRARVLFVAVVPLVCITLLLGYYLVNSRLSDAEESIRKQGESLLQNLASASEFGLFADNRDLLQAVVDGAVRDPEVAWAAVQGSDRRQVVSAGTRPVPTTGDKHYFRFVAPIHATPLLVLDYAQERTGESSGGRGPEDILGWVEVALSREPILERQRRILGGSLFLILLGLMGSILVGLGISRSVSQPLLRLSETLHRLGRGDLGARLAETSSGELGVIERGFNEMATVLQRVTEELEGEVDKATRKLQHTVEALSRKNHELEQARELALAAGREKSDFLARMSHEIRTPLNAVVGFSRLLQENPERKAGAEYTRTINQAATQLLYVIDGILNYTRIESGALTLERMQFDLARCLEDVVMMLRPSAHEKGLELVLLLHADLPRYIEGDPNRINQVLMNLINNAVKFTPAGHVLVQASRVTRDGECDRIRISVSDTGVGLSAEECAHLFQPFSQADATVTRRFGGTGLGLAISHRLVELMGGNIDVDSVKGQGSTFRFCLPCREIEGPATESGPALLNGRRVCLYDAHPVVRRALRATLQDWHVELFNTGDTEQLTAMLADRTGTIGTCDVLVLGLDRTESRPTTTEALHRELRRVYDGPMLLLVGAETWKLPESLREDRRLSWISKPSRRETLFDALCRVMEVTQRVSSTAVTPGAPPGGLAGARVLVAEDNAFNRELVRILLEDRGAKVDEAGDGVEALQACAGADYELVLMDIHMPRLDGQATARRLRELAGDRRLPPIIALTADVFSRIPEDLDDVLHKPVTTEALDAVLARWFPRPAVGPGAVEGGLRAAGMPTVPVALLPRLHDEVRRLCGQLQAAMLGMDRVAIRERAHQLKGLCGYYELPALTGLARELEQRAESGTALELQGLLEGIESCLPPEGTDFSGAEEPAPS